MKQGEAGSLTALIPLQGISERQKKKGEKPSSDLAEIRNLTMNTLHIQLAHLCSHGDGYKSVSAAIHSPVPKI